MDTMTGSLLLRLSKPFLAVAKMKKAIRTVIPVMNMRKTIHNRGPSTKVPKSILRRPPLFCSLQPFRQFMGLCLNLSTHVHRGFIVDLHDKGEGLFHLLLGAFNHKGPGSF